MYGIMNEAIRENATPAVAALVVTGRGTVAEQTAVAQSIEDRHGPHAWAEGTVADCAR